MKRKWGKAIIEVQRFVPQDYCAVCDETGAGKIYQLVKITDISPANALRVDNITPYGIFQTGEIWNVSLDPGPTKYTEFELDAMKVTADKYVRETYTAGSSESSGSTKYVGDTKISYKIYNETIYAKGTQKYAYKAKMIHS